LWLDVLAFFAAREGEEDRGRDDPAAGVAPTTVLPADEVATAVTGAATLFAFFAAGSGAVAGAATGLSCAREGAAATTAAAAAVVLVVIGGIPVLAAVITADAAAADTAEGRMVWAVAPELLGVDPANCSFRFKAPSAASVPRWSGSAPSCKWVVDGG
jgi:hypothetical protein